MCRARAQQLAEQLQVVYLRDKKASETVRAGVLEALGLLVEVAPQVQHSYCPCHHQDWHLSIHSICMCFRFRHPSVKFLSMFRQGQLTKLHPGSSLEGELCNAANRGGASNLPSWQHVESIGESQIFAPGLHLLGLP